MPKISNCNNDSEEVIEFFEVKKEKKNHILKMRIKRSDGKFIPQLKPVFRTSSNITKKRTDTNHSLILQAENNFRARRSEACEEVLCEHQAIETIKKFLKSESYDMQDFYPLHLVAKYNIPFVKAVLEKKIDINGKDKEQNAALHITAKIGHYMTTNELVKNGADCDIEDKNGFTPLYHASLGNNIAAMHVLLHGGASVSKVVKSLGIDVECINHEISLKTCNEYCKGVPTAASIELINALKYNDVPISLFEKMSLEGSSHEQLTDELCKSLSGMFLNIRLKKGDSK